MNREVFQRTGARKRVQRLSKEEANNIIQAEIKEKSKRNFEKVLDKRKRV